MRLRVRLNPTKIKAKFKQVVNVSGSGGGTWGTITGTITDQTDLVSYVTSRLVGYATEAWVNAQGFVTNVLGVTLTGLNTALTGAISATDTVLEAFGKLQNQIDGKENTITTLPISKGGTNSGTALNNNRVMQSSGGAIVEAAAITANRALVSDANGIPVASLVSDTTLGYLDATSSVQTQLNNRIEKNIGATYTTNALTTMTAAEYAASSKDANTLYFII
jgi:hypothetical protein